MNPMEAFLSGKKVASEGQDHLVEDEPSSMRSGKITFKQPAGFKIPDGVKDGEPFDAMATMKLENGKLVLHELDGTPVDDENEGMEETPEEESYETPEEEGSEDESMEDLTEESAPIAEEPEADDEGEPEDFLSAIEKKAKKLKK